MAFISIFQRFFAPKTLFELVNFEFSVFSQINAITMEFFDIGIL